MKYRFFAIPALNSEQQEAVLNVFCSQHRVAAIEKHFVNAGNSSYWSICISWLPVGNVAADTATGRRKNSIDYKEVLSESDFAIYAELRNLRKQQAQQDGVPPYAIFTNQQLAQMVQQQITSKAGLLELEGVGPARANKYGAVFLEQLALANRTHDAPGTD